MRKPKKQMWRQLIDIRVDGAGSLQSQIRVGIVDAILSGALPAGSAAPSSRELASDLKISRNTVVLAYHQLVDDGYLLSHERSGFVVAPIERIVPEKPAVVSPAQSAAEPDWEARFRVRASTLRSIVKPSNWQSYRYPFLYGQYDPDLFPLAEWRQCSRQALSVMELRDWAPDQIDQDDPMLVEQLRTRILPRRGIWAQPAEIMITLGAQQALYLLAELLFGRDTAVGVEDPGYPDMRHIAALKSDRLSLLPVDEDGLIPGAGTTACDYVYLTPSHQCPTTVTMPLARREALLAEARASGTVFIEDDYESETRLSAPPLPALKSLDSDGRVIYVGSLSKVLAPGLRIGFIVAPATVIREARALRRLMIRHPPFNNQRAAALFLSYGHHEALVGRLSKILADRSNHLRDAIERHLPDFEIAPGAGGSSLWLRAPPVIDAADVAKRAHGKGLLFEPGNVFFGDERRGRSHFRLGYSSIPAERIDAGIALLARCLAPEPEASGQI
jgi:GntR family transcriptional regulator/MocR family aminotransferase